MPSKREVPADMLEALARYNAAQGHFDDPKVTSLKAPRTRLSKKAPAPAPRKNKKKMTPVEYRDAVMAQYKLAPLTENKDVPAYDVTRSIDQVSGRPDVHQDRGRAPGIDHRPVQVGDGTSWDYCRRAEKLA